MQERAAKKPGSKHVCALRLEGRDDVKVSTLRGYVKALGGELQLLVTFPKGGKVEIAGRRKAKG